MTTYTAIASTEIDSDSPITTGLMTKMRDNPIAITEGSAGAPNIQTAAIANDAITSAKIVANAVDTSELASGSVKQSILSTVLTSETSHTTGSGVSERLGFLATGGQYVLGWENRVSNVSDVGVFYMHAGLAGASAKYGTGHSTSNQALYSIYLIRGGVPNVTGYVRHRYVSASAPYKVGETDFPYFAYLSFNKDDKLISTSLAIDPPWAYNGPFKASADAYKKQYKPLSIAEEQEIKEIDKKLEGYEPIKKQIDGKAQELDGQRAIRIKKQNELQSFIGREQGKSEEIEKVKSELAEINKKINKIRNEKRKLESKIIDLDHLSYKKRFLLSGREVNITPMIRIQRMEKKVLDLKYKDPLAYLQAKKEIKEELIELTPEHKNINMKYCPRPFDKSEGGKIVLVAPDDKVVDFMTGIHEDDDINIRDLIADGYVTLNEEVTLSETPQGVNIVRMKFKNNP